MSKCDFCLKYFSNNYNLKRHQTICKDREDPVRLLEIEKGIKPDDTELVVKTEKHILSKNFTNQRCFREVDKDNVKSIIREYKLNSINI